MLGFVYGCIGLIVSTCSVRADYADLRSREVFITIGVQIFREKLFWVSIFSLIELVFSCFFPIQTLITKIG